jgi:hypothetical protein
LPVSIFVMPDLDLFDNGLSFEWSTDHIFMHVDFLFLLSWSIRILLKVPDVQTLSIALQVHEQLNINFPYAYIACWKWKVPYTSLPS